MRYNINFFAFNFKRLRIESEMTQEQFAEMAGVSISSIQKYEQRRAFPSMQVMVEICNNLDIDFNEFFALPEERKERQKILKGYQDEEVCC